MKSLVFIGGIHGVGKSVVCNAIANERDDLRYYSSSELIKWENNKVKEVIDIEKNQDVLVQALESLDVLETNPILLDGHFCLLTCNESIQEVPISTFFDINPTLIIVITADESVVQERLMVRDHKNYEIDLLCEFQAREKNYAKQVASELKVPCFFVTADDLNLILNIINSYL